MESSPNESKPSPAEGFRFDRDGRKTPWGAILISAAVLAVGGYAYYALVHIEKSTTEAPKGPKVPVAKGKIPELPPQPADKRPVAKKPDPSKEAPGKEEPKRTEGARIGEGLEFPFYENNRRSGILRARTFTLQKIDDPDGRSLLQWPELVFFDVNASATPGADDPDSEGATITARGHRGMFSRKDNYAILEEGVEVRDETGVLHTDRLRANFQTRILETEPDEPVSISRPGLSIEGRGLWIARSEGVLEIRKDVKAAFDQGGTAAAGAPKEKEKEKSPARASDPFLSQTSNVESLRASCDGTLRMEGVNQPGPAARKGSGDERPTRMRFRKNVRVLIRQKDDDAPTHLTSDELEIEFKRQPPAPGQKEGPLSPTRLVALEGSGQPVVLRRGGYEHRNSFESVGGRFTWDFATQAGEMTQASGGGVVIRQGKNALEGSLLTMSRKETVTQVDLAGPVRGTLWKPPSAPPAPKPAPDKGPAAPATSAVLTPAPAGPTAKPADPSGDVFARYREALEGKVSCEKFFLTLRAEKKEGEAPKAPVPADAGGSDRLEEMVFSGAARVTLGPAVAEGREIRYIAKTQTIVLLSEGPGRRAHLEDAENALWGERIEYEMAGTPRLLAVGSARGRFRGNPGAPGAGVRLAPGSQPFEMTGDRIAIQWEGAQRRLEGVEADGKVEIFSDNMRGAGDRLRWNAQDLVFDLFGAPARIQSREGTISGRRIRHDDRKKIAVIEEDVSLKILDAARGTDALGLGGGRKGPPAPDAPPNTLLIRSDRLEVEFETDESAAAIEMPAGRMRRALATKNVYLENPRGKAWGDVLTWDAKAERAVLEGNDARLEIPSNPPYVLNTGRFEIETPQPTTPAPKGAKAQPDTKK